MANSVPSDKLVDLQSNAQTLDEVVSSDATTVTARPTPTDPTGKVIKTLAGIDADVELALQRIGVQYSDPITDWTALTEITAFEAHRYPATTGDIYIPTAPLPFTTGATFDSANWTLFQGVNSAYLETRLEDQNAIVAKTLADAIADTTAYEGKYVRISDRNNRLFQYQAGLTTNDRDIVAADAVGIDIIYIPENKTRDLLAYGVADGYSGTADPFNDAMLSVSNSNDAIVDARNLGTITLSTAIIPQSNVVFLTSGTTFIASAEMTALVTKLDDVDNFHMDGGVLDANSQANTGCIQHTLGYMRDCSFKNIEVKNTVGSWQIKTGYAEGSAGSPGSEASNVTNRSYRVVFENITFGLHATTTLEQLLIVNTEDSDVNECKFYNNQTITYSLLIFAYSENIRVRSPYFEEFTTSAIGVQHSTTVRVLDPVYKTSSVTPRSLNECVQSYDVKIIRPTAAIFSAVDAGPAALGLFNFSGDYFEGTNLENKYDRCRDCWIEDSPSLKGCYGILQIPFQKQSDKSFIFERCGSRRNVAENLTGQPYIIGSYTVVDALTQLEGINNIVMDDIIVAHESETSGAALLAGTSTSYLSKIECLSNIPASNKTSDRAIVGSFIDGLKVRGNLDTVGEEDAVIEFASTVVNYDVYIDANRKRVTRNNSLGNIDGVNLRSTDKLETLIGVNAQGGTIASGSVVIIKSTTEGFQVSMTTTDNDYRVAGLTAESSENDEFVRVVTQGRTDCLVTGTLSIGDRIGASTTQGYADISTVSGDSVALALASNTGVGTIEVLAGWNK